MKTRFCPSPSGLMHTGNVRTALFNALLARGHNGQFLLRIENTDQARSSEEFAQAQQYDLHWLGLDWQEGPGIEGPNGPYWQAQRSHIYDHYYQQLIDTKQAYPCFCTEQQLEISRKTQIASGQPPRYAGTCRHLTAEKIAEKRAQNIPAALRFQMPTNITIEFEDLVKGPQHFMSDDIGDFIIRRADGSSSFMFCNAIDDSLMGVTHSIRGEDHLTNTPRQLMILRTLKMREPQYGHLNLILGHDGAPLSKRNGSRSIQELREQGFLPLALINYMARLGHYYENPQWMDFLTLAQQFKLECLGRAPARFDDEQLLHWQKETIIHSDDNTLWNWLGAPVHELVPTTQRELFLHAVRTNIVFPKDGLMWAKIFFSNAWEMIDSAKTIFNTAGKIYFETAIAALKQNSDHQQLLNTLKQQLNIKGKALFEPLRVALTGQGHGPELATILNLLGTQETIQRLNNALSQVSSC